MGDTLVSVIIPVYNVEKYLSRCLNSVQNQTYANIEIIVIDDGSKDNSSNICDMFSKKDSRFKIIHKENGGLSDARNKGLEYASGEYVLFVDSDDYIEPDAIKRLLEIAKSYGVDIVEGKATSFDDNYEYDNFVSKGIETNHIYDGLSYSLTRIRNHCFYAPVWLKFYKRSYLESINASFVLGRLHEDEIWNPKVMIQTKKVLYTDYSFYKYDISRDDSIMKKISVKNVESKMNNTYELIEFYKTRVIDNNDRKELINYALKQYMATSLDCKSNIKWYKEKRKPHYVYKNVKGIKFKLIALIYIFNLNLFIKLLEK